MRWAGGVKGWRAVSGLLSVYVCAGARAVVSEGCARVRRQPLRPHRVPADHATSEVLVRALHARVDNVHAHAAARQVAIIVDAVDRAACVPGASDEGKMLAAGRTIKVPSS